MQFTIDQLSAFLAVARERGVRRAAETLHLSQPAVSARIQALETALAARLFERGGGAAGLQGALRRGLRGQVERDHRRRPGREDQLAGSGGRHMPGPRLRDGRETQT